MKNEKKLDLDPLEGLLGGVIYEDEQVCLSAVMAPGVSSQTGYVLQLKLNSLQLLFTGPALIAFISSMVTMAASPEVISILDRTMLELCGDEKLDKI